MNIKDLTIAFTSHNCLEYLQLAIWSLLDLDSSLRPLLLVFDDQSTDGTREWLQSENIRCISWTTSSYIVDLNKLLFLEKRHYGYNTPGSALSLRNSLMITDLIRHCSSKYLLLNDADLIFLDLRLHQKYRAFVDKGVSVAAPLDVYSYGWKYFNLLKAGKSSDKLFGDYKILYNCSGQAESMKRLHLCHAFFNLNFLRSKQRTVLDDCTNPHFVSLLFQRSTLDTGSDFYRWLLSIEADVVDTSSYIYNKWYNLDNPQAYFVSDNIMRQKSVYHFRWVASYKKLQEIECAPIASPHLSKIERDLQSCAILRERIRYITTKYTIRLPEEVVL